MNLKRLPTTGLSENGSRKPGRGMPVISVFNFSRYKKYDAARDAFDYWAQRLRRALDRAHGVRE